MKQAGQVCQKPCVRIVFMACQADTEYPAQAIQQRRRLWRGILLDDIRIVFSEHAGGRGYVWPEN